MTAVARPMRQSGHTKRPARSHQPFRQRPPAGSHKLQLKPILPLHPSGDSLRPREDP
jgi:hypothetical protein